ncbi:hypothetical protein BSQ44_24050 [Aquibium oceanicum]|uniref:Uncharacterized protein n=1 Tax=Aquibium oceanicum TaxID=1670800 RepID=A0A1L3SXR2_9HYPH|nr:hypothetical protein BSQ44_24050 [Aquibium oceanicum]
MMDNPSDTFVPDREMIDAVAEWNARRPQDRVRRALIPTLCERFGITNKQAIEVLRAATLRRRRAA